MVKDWKGGEVKRVEEREASVAMHWSERRSKTAIWWMSLWMWGTSVGWAKRILAKSGWPLGVEPWGTSLGASGAGLGGGGGAAAAIVGFWVTLAVFSHFLIFFLH